MGRLASSSNVRTLTTRSGLKKSFGRLSRPKIFSNRRHRPMMVEVKGTREAVVLHARAEARRRPDLRRPDELRT
ncbi:hypothetical protein EVAR_67530_1 [Eumeta japonica]|uniref:Uncharacterized protein n=1 Tax=Eumeta variegata TaxID=151549 RepID=A0A4C1YY89_EUMVA|nr:hypothetical protein EVAR_67530_1 [Eumeta japonica]